MTNHWKVFAFAATTAPTPSTSAAGSALQATANVAFDTLDQNDFEMQIYSPDHEARGIPQQAHDFYAHIGEAEGLIILLAECNGSYTAAFKSIFGWSIRIRMQVFQDKPTLLMATSIGARGGQNVLDAALTSFPHFEVNIMSSFFFGPFADHFGDQGLCTPALQNRLKTRWPRSNLPCQCRHNSQRKVIACRHQR